MYIKPTVFNDKLILKLFEVFINEFEKFRNSAESDETEMLDNICPSVFRKWFHSALIDDTPLTPANITMNLSGEKNKSFTIQRDKKNGSSNWVLVSAYDAIDDSVFIKDLHKICDHCSPVGEINFYNPNDIYTISEKIDDIFIKDGYYACYISLMAERLGLIEKMPSINTVKYQKNNAACNEFFSLNSIAAHKILLKKAVEIFIEKVAFQTQAPINASHINGIIDVLCGSCITDSLFSYIYSLMGFDFDKIADLGRQSTLSEDDEALVSSVLYMGILIDKWLITPLGYYMGLLKPYYASPYSFFEDYDYLRPVLTTGCDLSVELFTPPNYYVLTEKGFELFGKRQDDYLSYTLKGSLTEEDLNEILNAYSLFLKMLESSALKKSTAENIYSLKAYFKNNENMWKILEMDTKSTLEDLKNEIVMYFGFSDSKKYSFEYENRVYTPYSKFKNLNSTENTTLLSLNLSNGSKLLYSNGFDKSLDIIIVSSDIKPANKKAVYPRLYRQSYDITQHERNDEF